MGQLAGNQRLLKREEYETMVEAGLFHDERVELLRGLVVEMSPQNTAHAGVVQALTRALLPPLLDRAEVRIQLPFVAGSDSLPEPDVAVVARGRYLDAHPDQAHLIVEVAGSSLKLDRQEKAQIYASANVPEYWVVNVADRSIERYTEASRGAYARLTPFRRGESVTLVSFPDVAIAVDELFGP